LETRPSINVNSMTSPARNIFRWALLIFTITIVIGILNGLDVWDPPRTMILTHVHAGTLGWITLSVVGAAILLFGEGASDQEVRSATTLGYAVIGAVALYVVAFATTTGVFRPIAGTLVLIVIVWVLVWVSRRYAASERSTSRLGMLLAVISLTVGAILGVLLGLFIAQGSLPGMDEAQASNLAGAHPVAMLVGYLILAGAAIAHWVLGGRQGMLGKVVVWLLFIAGIIANISFIFDIEALIQVFSLLQVVAIVLFIVHMWPSIAPAAWSEDGGGQPFARMSVIFLVVGIALLVYTVQLFVSGELNPETGEGPVGVLIAFDHSMFIGVMTNALLATVVRLIGGATERVVLWAVNGGLLVFLIGLVSDTAVIKRIGAPVMGLALLYAIYVYWRQLGSSAKAV
jgi:hypothetical protein